MCSGVFVRCFAEKPPEYRFDKRLPKQSSAYVGEDITLMCTVNDHRAPVKWYRGDKEIEADGAKYEVEKDIIGNCRLLVRNPQKGDVAKYSCKIVGREKDKSCVTKTELVLKGSLAAQPRQRFLLLVLIFATCDIYIYIYMI